MLRRTLRPCYGIRAAVLGVMLVGAGFSNSSAGEPSNAPSLSGPLGLQDCVALALEHNLELKIRRVGLRRVRESVEIAEAGFDPRISGSVGYSESASAVAASDLDGARRPTSSSQDANIALSKPLQTGGSVGLSLRALDRLETNSEFVLLNPTYNSSLSVNVRQPLLRGRGRDFARAGITQALLVEEGAILRFESGFHRLLASVENAYWTAAASELVAEVSRGSLEIAELVLEETSARAALDDARRIDVLEAEVAVAERRESVLSAEIQSDGAKDDLLRIIGVLGASGTDSIKIGDRLPSQPSSGSPDPDQVYAAAMAASPDQRSLRTEVEASKISASSARNDRLPTLDLSASGGVSGRAGSFTDAGSAAARPDGEFWQFGLEFSMPLGRRAEQARYRSALAGVEEAKLTEDVGALDLLAEVRAACREHERATAALAAVGSSLELQEARLELQQAKREGGEAVVREVLEAEFELASARLRSVQARVSLAAAEVEIARLTGTLPVSFGVELGAVESSESSLKP